MPRPDTIERLENRLEHLIATVLDGKRAQIDFLIGLNRLDDILGECRSGQLVIESLGSFLSEYRCWLDQGNLQAAQKKRLGSLLSLLYSELLGLPGGDHQKLCDEIKEWLKKLGDGAFRLTLKSPGEQASLADRFHNLLRREQEELNMLLAEQDHLLTCLDDVLKSADAKNDTMYEHLAASLVYFLQMEGYKADPYVRELRRIRKH